MKIKFLFGGLVLALSIAHSYADCAQSDGSELKSVAKASNKFSHDFYKILATQKSGNLICSPISVSLVLAMTRLGAQGNTEKQLESSLYLPCNKTVTKQGFQQLIRSLNNVQGVELKLANKIFINNGAALQPDFQEITRTSFDSEIQSVNFTKSDETANIINNYCAEKTNNRITNLLKPDDIENAAMVLINAIFFKGKWAKKFNPQSTRSSDFHIDKNTTKKVPMMFQMGEFNWGYKSDFKFLYVELPYESTNKSDDISMFIILPDKSTPLREVENNIHKLNFSELFRIEDEIFLSLPKFKIQNKLDLKPVIQNMGITDLFEEIADLGGIIENANLKVSKIIQKAFIEVNEEGSEAAAATGIGSVTLSLPSEVTIDRPFVFAIVKKSNGMPLMLGHVIDPTSEY